MTSIIWTANNFHVPFREDMDYDHMEDDGHEHQFTTYDRHLGKYVPNTRCECWDCGMANTSEAHLRQCDGCNDPSEWEEMPE